MAAQLKEVECTQAQARNMKEVDDIELWRRSTFSKETSDQPNERSN